MTDRPTLARSSVTLRSAIDDDLPVFFAHQLDPEANRMAAFTAKDPADRDTFMAHWGRILSDETITVMTILFEGRVAGYLAYFLQAGKRSVCYWIGKDYWGKGIATEALRQFLSQVPARPLYARAAKDNIGSVRVLRKCGFTVWGEDRGFSHARGCDVEEHIFRLEE